MGICRLQELKHREHVLGSPHARGGRGTPVYKPYRYVPSRQVGFLRRFGLKTGVHFSHLGLESGMVSEGISEYIHLIRWFSI